MSPTQNLGYLVQHLAMVMGKQSEEVLQRELGIGLSQYRILAVLDWNPRVQQSVIASSLGQSEASISRQIKILEKRDLVMVEKDPLNRRKHIARPTPKGMQVTEEANNIIRRNLSPEYSNMGEAELVQLAKGLVDLHKLICRRGRKGSCNHPLGI